MRGGGKTSKEGGRPASRRRRGAGQRACSAARAGPAARRRDARLFRAALRAGFFGSAAAYRLASHGFGPGCSGAGLYRWSKHSFGAGQYAPATQTGQRLLAHELTHVVQQERGVALSSPLGRDGSTGAAAPTFFRPAPGAIAQPTIQRAPLCAGTRDSGEVTKSQSQAGVLAVDTDFDAAKESLSVHDFGIDQDSVPPTLTQSDDWRRMMSDHPWRPDHPCCRTRVFRLHRYRKNNQGLRDRRADAVVKAMPAEAQARATFKGWWGSLSYLFPNDTAENRARNRMVLIALIRSLTDSWDGLPKATNIDQFNISGQLPGKTPGPDQCRRLAEDPVSAPAIVFRERRVEHGAQSQ